MNSTLLAIIGGALALPVTTATVLTHHHSHKAHAVHAKVAEAPAKAKPVHVTAVKVVVHHSAHTVSLKKDRASRNNPTNGISPDPGAQYLLLATLAHDPFAYERATSQSSGGTSSGGGVVSAPPPVVGDPSHVVRPPFRPPPRSPFRPGPK